MEWRGGGTRGVECVKWFSAGSGCLDRVGSGSGKRQWQWKVAMAVESGGGSGKWRWQWQWEEAVEVGIGSDSRKWDASGIVPEGCQKLGLSLVRRGFSKYNEVACEGFTGLE